MFHVSGYTKKMKGIDKATNDDGGLWCRQVKILFFSAALNEIDQPCK